MEPTRITNGTGIRPSADLERADKSEKMSPLSQAFEQNSISRNELRSNLVFLEKRLSIILSLEDPDKEGEKEALGGPSDLVTEINRATQDITFNNVFLKRIIDRITL